MIKLFRNIRQNLLADPPERAFSVPARQSHSGGRAGGKTSRYLKYAIGEIVLVVIGILIRKIIKFSTMKRPIRDEISVETERKINQRAFRYAIYMEIKWQIHIPNCTFKQFLPFKIDKV